MQKRPLKETQQQRRKTHVLRKVIGAVMACLPRKKVERLRPDPQPKYLAGRQPTQQERRALRRLVGFRHKQMAEGLLNRRGQLTAEGLAKLGGESLGHTSCGGVAAQIQAAAADPSIAAIALEVEGVANA